MGTPLTTAKATGIIVFILSLWGALFTWESKQIQDLLLRSITNQNQIIFNQNSIILLLAPKYKNIIQTPAPPADKKPKKKKKKGW